MGVRTQNDYSSQFPYQNLIPLKLPHHAFIIRPLPAPYKLPRCHFSHLLFFAASSQTPLNRDYSDRNLALPSPPGIHQQPHHTTSHLINMMARSPAMLSLHCSTCC